MKPPFLRRINLNFAALTVLLFSVGLAFTGPMLTSGCQTAPSARVTEVKTLLTVGQTADAVVALSAQLYAAKKITPEQAKAVIAFYDSKFQPAYRVAVAAAKADLSSVASPDLVALAAQLVSLIPAR